MGMQTYLQLFSFLLKLHVVFKTMKLLFQIMIC